MTADTDAGSVPGRYIPTAIGQGVSGLVREVTRIVLEHVHSLKNWAGFA